MSSAADFDFLFDGPWHVANRRLTGDGAWERFDAVAEVRPLLGGLGHLDCLTVPDLPGVGRVEAFTVRLFDPAADLWRIWWSSSARPGHLDPPMIGRFEHGVGTFYGDDVPGPEPVSLRFVWEPLAPGGPRWEQARSWDDGASWHTDWTMELSPADGRALEGARARAA